MAKNTTLKTPYVSHFYPSNHVIKILVNGKILDEGEPPNHMIERVVYALTEIEEKFGTGKEERCAIANEFGTLLDEEYCVMSTPILTNAGRYIARPLFACTIPSLDLAHGNINQIKQKIFKIHQDGMGTGFSLDNLADPVKTLHNLNDIAIESALSGKENRPVGNIATLSVYDPKIFEFINAKIVPEGLRCEWKFSTSINCDYNFFEKLKSDKKITLQNYKTVKARDVFNTISQAAYFCGDPGLIFLERMEADNPTPHIGRYISTAPCAEAPLMMGESCQFGYINLSKFLNKFGEISIKKLKRATHILTRILDNALEISLCTSHGKINKIAAQRRKIGIGVCGLADLFIKKGVFYNSEKARNLALNVVTLINFESKIESHELAKTRGSFSAMALPTKNEYLKTPSLIEKKYGSLVTKYVSQKDWANLAKKIRETKLLRNVSTIALPPVGRSALVINASNGIEPIFSKKNYLALHPELKNKNCLFLQTAKDISPEDHLLMMALIQKGVDDSISKTVNLSKATTAKKIAEIYLMSWEMGLKGISIYRDGSKNKQPKKL